MKKVGVIAGTPVDTGMGADYLKKRAAAAVQSGEQVYEAVSLPLFENPRQCHVFQMSDGENKHRVNADAFQKGFDRGCESFFIYCNSLSASFRYDSLAAEMGTKAVTPLDAYRLLAGKYNRLALIAANGQACAGIEKAFTDANPSCYILSLGILPLVEAIEKGTAPEQIVRDFRLSELIAFFRRNGAEALVLGCTHFPYLKQALQQLPEVAGSTGDWPEGFEIIDPADIMYSLL